MNKKCGLNKFIAVILMLAISLASAQSVFAYKWEETPPVPESDKIIFENTGERDGFTGTFDITSSGRDGSGISLGKKPYITQLIKKFTYENENNVEMFKNGRALINFDVQAKQTDHCLVFAINDSKNSSYAAFVMNGTGMMYYNKSTSWPTAKNTPDHAVPYEKNRWYNIKILIDSHNRRIVYYKDNVYWGEYLITKSTLFNTQVYPEMTVTEMMFNFHADMTIKDGNVVKSDGSGEFVLDNIEYSLPKFDEYDMECTTGEIGNIVRGKTAKLKYTFENDSDTDKNLVLKYDIISADNRRVDSGKKSFVAKSKSSEEVEVETNVDKYGFYIARSYLYDGDEIKNSLETRFSCIVNNEKQNPKTGFSAHPLAHGRGTYEETIGLTKNLGGSLLRDDYPMWQMYKEDGVTKKAFYAPFVNYPTLARESGVTVLPIMGPGPDNMCGVNWPPTLETMQNTKVLDMWSNYAKELAEMLKGKCDEIEIYNEWPGQATNKTKATPAAYAEFLKATSKALREANPDVKVVAFCCFYSDAEWMDGVLEALGTNPGQYFDAVSIHPYMNYWTNILYPDPDYTNGMENVMAVLNKYGVGDKPLYATEYGFSTEYTAYGEKTIDEKRKSDYSTRMMLLGGKYFAKNWLYTITKKVGMSVGYEAGIGHTASNFETEIPYEALPAAVSFAAFNYIFNGSEFLSDKVYPMEDESAADDIYLNKYKLADGKECYAIWQVSGEKTYSLDFGADSVKIYDSYGNERELYAADGYITMKVSEEPMYITADSLTEPKFRAESLIDMDYSADTMVDSNFSIGYTNHLGGDIGKEITLSDNMTVTNSEKSRDAEMINVKTGNARGNFENYAFRNDSAPEQFGLKLTKGGRVIFDENADVFYDDCADVNLEVVPYKSGRWQAVCSIRNNNQTSDIDGNIKLSLSDGTPLNMMSIGKLSSGQKRILRFNIPQNMINDNIGLAADINLDNGSEIKRGATSEFAAFVKTDAPPKIDGELSDGEWSVYTKPIMLSSADSAKRYAGWGGVPDLSGEVYAMYDDENFYLAAKVRDNVHFGADSQKRLWAQDCVQFSFSPGDKGSSPITEFAVSLCDGADGEKTEIERYLSAVSSAEDYDLKNIGKTEAVISHSGENTLIYEIKVPWSEIFPKDYKIADSLNFSMLIADNDGTGRRGWLEFGRGIGDSKDASRFKKVMLVK